MRYKNKSALKFYTSPDFNVNKIRKSKLYLLINGKFKPL